MTISRTERALEAQEAAIAEMQKGGVLVEYFDEQATELMRPESLPVVQQGEIVPADDSTAMGIIKDTLEDPDTPAVEASSERTQLLLNAGALEIGIDAANTIEAKNSLEKMLTHQMSVCHVNGMRLMTEAMGMSGLDSNTQHLMLKKMNLAARLMDTYQKGFDTLTKARTAGKQTIVVKQVHVTGGQNVITDSVTARGGSRGGRPS